MVIVSPLTGVGLDPLQTAFHFIAYKWGPHPITTYWEPILEVRKRFFPWPPATKHLDRRNFRSKFTKTLGIGWINLLWVGFHFETEFNPPRNGGKTENHIFTVKIIYIYIFLEPVCPLFLGFKKRRPKLQSKQGSSKGSRFNQTKGHLGSRFIS